MPEWKKDALSIKPKPQEEPAKKQQEELVKKSQEALSKKQQENPLEESYQKQVSASLSKIDAAIGTLKNKISKEDQHHSSQALLSARALLDRLSKARDEYAAALNKKTHTLASNNAAGNQFKKECNEAINEAKPVLERDLEWGDYLTNLLKDLFNAILWTVSLGQANSSSFLPPKKPLQEKRWSN
jgi:small-conductance mechanosensitive channel